MGTIPNPENHIHLVLDNRLPIDKDIKDKEYSDYLRDSAYIFKDGNEEYVDLFYAKVGINGNKWGLGLDGFEQNVDSGIGLKLIIDPNQEVHKANEDGTGAYSTDYVEQKQDDLYGGKVVRMKKYDLDHDGRIDYARAIVHLDTEEGKERFHNALVAGLNETSPTVDALDPTERWDALTKVKFINITMVKNGAYKEYSKIQHICKGTMTSCGNALAAGLPNEEKNDGSLIHVLGHYTYMGNDSKDTPTGQTAPNQPMVQNFNFGNKDDVTKEGEQKQTPNTPEVSESEKALKLQLETVTKQLKQSESLNVANIYNELAPIELFDGKEDERKEVLKILGDSLPNLVYAKNVVSALAPRLIALYNKNNSGKKDEKKDEKSNPAVGSLPAFDNSPSTPNSTDNDLVKALNNKSLDELFKMNLKIMNKGVNA